jgi:zinc transport system ATP-binding protein
MAHPTTSPNDVILRCHQLVVGWQRQPLLPPIDLALIKGRFVAVVGRNGSGKTTWFKTLLGEAPPISGSIERAPELDHIAYVPQSDAFDRILPLTAYDVVVQGRLHCNNFLWPFLGRSEREAAHRALDEAGAREFANATFRELSKGQRQRVMFARMLATEAELALLDEPTAAMDLVSENDAMDRLARLAREHAIAVVVISHTAHVAEEHADDILLFDRMAGEVLFGPRDEVLESDAYRRYRLGQRAETNGGTSDAD